MFDNEQNEIKHQEKIIMVRYTSFNMDNIRRHG